MQYYSYLSRNIAIRGLQDLEFCVLGPGQQHFARWLDGSISYWTSAELIPIIREHSRNIRAMAFGYRETCLFSFASERTYGGLSWASNLKDYYPTLSNLLADEKPVSILVSKKTQ